MTGTPQCLSETPPSSRVDMLSNLLDSMHLAGTVLFRVEFRSPWSVVTPKSCQLAQVLPFQTEHIIPFHIIAAGGCWLALPERQRVWLKEGDAVLLPYGDSHSLGGRSPAATVPVSQLLPPPPWSDALVVEHGGAGERTSIICGFLQCDALLFHPIMGHLPPLIHVSPEATPADAWLAGTIRHTAEEASKAKPGSRNMVSRLTELMFVEILRKFMHELSQDQIGWFAALNDPVAGAALKHLHTAPRGKWSVELLARQVGVSRTVLAERFKHFLGQPPMQYLLHWRLLKAAQDLKSNDLPIKTISDQAGYDTEAAFNRAFKRLFGVPPGVWRKQQGTPGKSAGPYG